MERIEELHLRNIIDIGLKQDANRDDTELRYFLAMILLRHYLGTAWCNDCAKPGPVDIPRGSRVGRLFLRTDSEASEARCRYQERVERLAELLYNLQDVQGIGGRRASIQEGVVESTYAELAFAGHFVRRGVRIRFVEPSGVKGNDYDFDVCEEAIAVCCEVKCKLETTDLSENTIINALEAARKQTPADRASIIGLKIPEPWIRAPALHGVFQSALASFFRNSSRVVAVVLRWEEVPSFSAGKCLILYKFRTFPNEGSRHLTNDIRQFVHQLTESPAEDWTSFRVFVPVYVSQKKTQKGTS